LLTEATQSQAEFVLVSQNNIITEFVLVSQNNIITAKGEI